MIEKTMILITMDTFKISKVSTRLETQHVSNTIYFISFTLSNYYVLHANDVGNWVLKGYKT